MSVYKVRKNHFPSFHYSGNLITGKVAVKSVNTDWLGTQGGVFLPISIKTSFHEGIEGEMKMRAMIETTRSSIQAPLLLLMADTAHCNVEELLEGPQARTKRLAEAKALCDRFSSLFEGCHIEFMSQLLGQDRQYARYRADIEERFREGHFQEMLLEDAYETYTADRRSLYRDESAYIERTIADIAEQATTVSLLAHRGYRFHIYPGRQYRSVEYLMRDLPIDHVHLFISIEKKKINPLSSTP